MFVKDSSFYIETQRTDIRLLGELIGSAVLATGKPTVYVDAAPGIPAQVAQPSNLRAWPRNDGDPSIVSTLQPGDTIEVLGRNEAGDWLYVRTSIGLKAWIAAFLVPGAPPLADLAVIESLIE